MVTSVVEYVRRAVEHDPTKKWAILGKGPTSDYHCRIDWSGYNVVTLNHAVRLGDTFLAHFVDLEAVWDNEPFIGVGQAIAMPWHPHFGMKPDARTLDRWADRSGPLQDSLSAGTLFSYNASCHAKLPKNPVLPAIRLRYFSAVAAFNILAAAGIKVIHTLGVDGGADYGSTFDKKDLLKNGRRSFDAQEAEIEKTCVHAKVRRVKLWVQEK